MSDTIFPKIFKLINIKYYITNFYVLLIEGCVFKERILIIVIRKLWTEFTASMHPFSNN